MFGMHEAVLFCSYLTETLPVNLSDADISQYFKIKVDLTGFLSATYVLNTSGYCIICFCIFVSC